MININLSDLSRFIYGTTRLGDKSIPFAERLAIGQVFPSGQLAEDLCTTG